MTKTPATQKQDKQGEGWRDHLPIHPSADVFPLLSKAELQELAEDIKGNGLQKGVTLWLNPKTGQEELLDGRNRLDALELLGDPIFDSKGRVRKEWSDSTLLNGYDPASFIISANIKRRHLTKPKRADLIVAAVKAGKSGRAKAARSVGGKKGGSTKDPVKAEVIARGAEQGIGARTMTQALVDAEPKRKRKSQQKEPEVAPPVEVQDILAPLLVQQAAAFASLGHGAVTVKVKVVFADGTTVEMAESHE